MQLAIYLSAFAFPGLGQFVQRRWFAGALFAVTFGICVTMVFIKLFCPLFANMNAVLNFAEQMPAEPFQEISLKDFFMLFGITVLVYAIGLVDTILAHRRRTRQWLAARRDELTKDKA